MTEKFCVKCGKKFIATGREVICPDCKTAAAEDAKRAAVLKAKRASWAGESVPVRISGRASTLIREYGAENGLPFAAALDALLQSTAFFQNLEVSWEEVKPYKSRRRDKSTASKPQAAKNTASKPQDAQEVPQEVKQAARVASKTASKPQEVKQVAKKAASTSKAAAGKKVKA